MNDNSSYGARTWKICFAKKFTNFGRQPPQREVFTKTFPSKPRSGSDRAPVSLPNQWLLVDVGLPCVQFVHQWLWNKIIRCQGNKSGHAEAPAWRSLDCQLQANLEIVLSYWTAFFLANPIRLHSEFFEFVNHIPYAVWSSNFEPELSGNAEIIFVLMQFDNFENVLKTEFSPVTDNVR